jgi:hypothetical protein
MLCWAAGGPQKYTGKDMESSHRHLRITQSEWDAFMDDVAQTLDKFRSPAGRAGRDRHKQQSSIEARLRELNETPPREIQQDLMVPQSLAAFDRAKIPDQAVLAATHSSESAIPEALHGAQMHRELIPSILDRVIRAGTPQIEGRDERGGCSSHDGRHYIPNEICFATIRCQALL